MTQILNVMYGDSIDNIVSCTFNTDNVQLSYTDSIGILGNYVANNTLSIGTINHIFQFKNFWDILKTREVENITKIFITDGDGNIIYELNGTIRSIIYNINFSGLGDSITFDYKEV